MKKIFIAFVLICSFSAGTLKAQSVYTIGPMLHFNFGGNNDNHFSFGLEAAYWNAFDIPYGFDVGIEWEKGMTRIYTEAQTGIVFAGISAGPFLEFSQGNSAKLGIQSSVWANAFVGLNLRSRFSKDENRFATGIYGKFLFTPGGDLMDEWNEHHESDGDDDWD